MPGSLPRVCLIADGFTDRVVQDRVIEAVEAGVVWVQLRDHDADDTAFRDSASRTIRRLRSVSPEVLISINARLDVALEQEAAFHTGVRGPSLSEARRLDVQRPLGFSVHSVEEAREIVRLGADYLIFSPVFETRSKPDAVPVGIEQLAEVCRAVAPTPVIALGGIDFTNARSCFDVGAAGVAVISSVLAAPDVRTAAKALLGAVTEAG